MAQDKDVDQEVQEDEVIDDRILRRIYDNYNYSNSRMVEEMELSSEHGGLTGGFREGMWLSFFRSIIPVKYQLAQGVIIIDSEGRVSNEVDIVVYDETYTPYVFQYNTLKFIPIEAVVMVIECKSKGYTPKQLKKWSDKIKVLTPVSSGIARIVGGYAIGETNKSQSRTRPIRVLVSLKTTLADKQELKAIGDLADAFDFIVEEKLDSVSKNKRLTLYVPHEDRSLGWWGQQLNQGTDNKLHPQDSLKLEFLDKAFNMEQELKDLQKDQSLPAEFKVQQIEKLSDKISKTRADQIEDLTKKYPELEFNDGVQLTNTLKQLRVADNTLLTLNLQLNQLLMLLNNPMLFPHFAYARAFNKPFVSGTSSNITE